MQPAHRLLRLGPHRVRDGERRERPAALDEMDRRSVPARQLPRERRPASGSPPPVAQEVGPPTRSFRPSTRASNAVAWYGLEGLGARRYEAPLLRRPDHRLRDRVLRVRLDRGREPSASSSLSPPSATAMPTTRCSPSVKVPVLSNTTVEVPRLFETAAIPHEQPLARAQRSRDRDDERDGKPERVRAGDDQDRDQPFDGKRRLGARR